LAREEAGPGRLVGAARRLEGAGPVSPDAVDVAHDPAVLAGVGIGPGLARRQRGTLGHVVTGATDHLVGQAADRTASAGIAAEQDPDDRDDEAESTAAHGEATAHAAAAQILHLRWVKAGTAVEHVAVPPVTCRR